MLTPSQDLSLWRLLIVAVTPASSHSPHASEVKWLHRCSCVRSVMNMQRSPAQAVVDTQGWTKDTSERKKYRKQLQAGFQLPQTISALLRLSSPLSLLSVSSPLLSVSSQSPLSLLSSGSPLSLLS